MTDVVIASYLEPSLIERIATARPDVRVHARMDLIPAPRYAADHIGASFERDAAAQAAWLELLARADALFDFDYVRPANMLEHAPRLRWIQASSSGIGQFIERTGLGTSNVVFTTAAGIHGRPLAEFVLWAILSAAKDYPLARGQQRQERWQRFHGQEILGSTLLMIGMGGIGRAVADLLRPLGVHVVGTKRDVTGASAIALGVDEIVPWTAIDDVLPRVDHVVLACPLTPETRGLMSARRLAACKPGSTIVNIGRGALVDHEALLRVLDDGPVATAVLDVTDPEPLPAGHPLWRHERVIVFPHSASTSVRENERLVDLFIDNLHRFVEGRPLRNVFDVKRGY